MVRTLQKSREEFQEPWSSAQARSLEKLALTRPLLRDLSSFSSHRLAGTPQML